MANGVRDLKLWQEAVALAADVLRNARHGMRRETKSFLDRMTATAVSVPESIAAGYAQVEAAGQQRLFESAQTSMAALETQVAVARQAGLFPAEVAGQVSARLTSVGRLLAGYLMYVERQRETEDEERAFDGSSAAAAPPLRKPLDEVNCA